MEIDDQKRTEADEKLFLLRQGIGMKEHINS